MSELDAFTRAYIDAALWSSTDPDGTPLDRAHSREDIHSSTVARMIADCARFQSAHMEDILCDLEQAGHDFWLTRNRHGAGFWDGDWPADIGARLTKAAHDFGEMDLYVGDDGQIHG